MTTISSIKIQLPNDEFRRFPFKSEHVGLTGLRSVIANLNEELLGSKTWRLQWTDLDGDRITVASDDELSLVYEYFALLDGVARFTITLQPEPRTHEAAGFERLLHDIVGNARVFVQGQPWASRGHGGRRGEGCRRRCARQQEQAAQEQAAQEQAAQEQAAQPATEASVPSVPDYSAAVKMPSMEPVSLSAYDEDQSAVAATSPASASVKRSLSGTSDDWNLVDEDELEEQPQVQPSVADLVKPRQRQRRSATDEKVAVLQGMGFPQDQVTLAALLRRHQGEISGVVAELFAGRN